MKHIVTSNLDIYTMQGFQDYIKDQCGKWSEDQTGETKVPFPVYIAAVLIRDGWVSVIGIENLNASNKT